MTTRNVFYDLDYALSNFFYETIGCNSNIYVQHLPYFAGLIPYELYVLPAMFVAIFCTFYFESLTPVRVQLLPQWFAYSVSLYMKNNIWRTRPGCLNPRKPSKLIDKKYCNSHKANQSFPSGHSILICSLASSIFLFLEDETVPNKSKDLGPYLQFADPTVQKMLYSVILVVVIMVMLHRVAYQFHFLSDVIVGAMLGVMIAYTCHHLFRQIPPGKVSYPLKVKEEVDGSFPKSSPSSYENDWRWQVTRVVGMILAVFGFFHFFIYNFRKVISSSGKD